MSQKPNRHKKGAKSRHSKVTCRDSKLSSSSASDSESLSTMADAAILDSLNLLHKKIDKMQTKSDELEKLVLGDKKEQKTGLIDQVNTFISSNEEILTQYQTLHQEHQSLKNSFNHLVGIVERQAVQIESLSQKVDKQTARSMRKNIVISGLVESEDDTEDAKSIVQKFFKDEMQIEPEINTAHRIGDKLPGKKTPRPMVTRLVSMEEKRKIFQNVKNLKGRKNSRGKAFFISDQLPESLAEERKKNSERIKQNKAKSTEEQLDLKVRGGKLYVNNQLVRPPVSRPSIDECLNVESDEMKKMEKLKLVAGDIKKEDRSVFYSYAVKVSSMQDIRRAYKKTIIQDPRATHVMLAYRFEQNGKSYSDYYDDGEYGGGFHMMKLITDCALNGLAVMTVRHYGGQHLGYKRFKLINDAAQSALYKLYGPQLQPAM